MNHLDIDRFCPGPHCDGPDALWQASLAETAMSRYKTVIGRGLRARTLPAQKTEARVGCSVLNRMTRLGMPVSQRIA